MKTSWQSDTGHLACHWSEMGLRDKYDPSWIQETSEVQSGYLPPLPDFASRSPFGGVAWFQPNSGKGE